MLIFIVLGILTAGTVAMRLPQEIMWGVTGIAYLFIVIFSIMLTIQRAHDFNTTGWITVLSLVPILNLMFLFIPGTDGENRFGKKTPPQSVCQVL